MHKVQLSLLCSGRSNLKSLQLPIYISIDGSFCFTRNARLDNHLHDYRRGIPLLYYLYCLCKSVQRSLRLRSLPFQKADAKIRTFSDNFQNFSKFFCFFFQTRRLSCEREAGRKKNRTPKAPFQSRMSICRRPRSRKRMQK